MSLRPALWLSILVSVFLGSASFAHAQSATAPTIASLSNSRTVTEGANVSLTVSVNGTAPFTYQWLKDGASIAGATNSTFGIDPVRVANGGTYTVAVTNAAGSITSGPIILAVNPATAPQFYYSPTSLSVTVGQTLSLSPHASGTQPITYVWKNGTTVVGTTVDQGYSKANAQLSDAGTYTVTATNIAGTATSGPLVVTVSPVTIPTVGTLSDRTVLPNDYVSFYANVSGTGSMTYQWYKDDVAIPGATSSSYYIYSASASHAGNYSYKVTNSAGTATSNSAKLTVLAPVPPTITSPPSGRTVSVGSSLSLSVSASGTYPMTYQWYKDGQAIAGATSEGYYKSAVQSSDAGAYHVVVTNAQGSATSAAAAVTVTSARPPVITYMPGSQAVRQGEWLGSLSVSAVGTSGLSYQWKKDGVALPGKTDSSLWFGKYAAASDAGSYTVVVTSAEGSVTSQPIVLTILPPLPPTITSHPASRTVTQGDDIYLSASVSGTSPFTYQWKKDGVAVSGATSSSLELRPVASSDAGVYSLTVANATGSATSVGATLTVIPPRAPQITSHPPSYSVLPGESMSLDVSYAADSGVTMQWYKDGVIMAGRTGYYLSIYDAQPANAGTYTCVVSNATGSVTTHEAVVTVDSNVSRPVITYVSGGKAVQRGSGVSIGVRTSGTAETFQWYKDGVIIANATAKEYSFSNFGPGSVGVYTVQVTNSTGTYTSRPIPLAMRDDGRAPIIRISPYPVSARIGEYVSFSVQAEGEAPLTYQWKKGGTDIPNATSSSYSFTGSTAAVGEYSVVVTNARGSATSAAATYSVATIQPPGPPVITSGPATQTVTAGRSSFSLRVSVLESAGVTYQWYKDGVAIANGTSSELYYYTSARVEQAGRYHVVLTNSTGSTTSNEALISVVSEATGPSFTTQPASATAIHGSSATFTAVATGTGTISYQWKKDGTAISGATNSSLTLTNVQSTDAGTYTIIASDSVGSASSLPAVLTVTTGSAPYIITSPTGGSVAVGGNITLTGAAGGSPAPAIQWRKNGSNIAGATFAYLSITNAQVSDTGTYTFVATNSFGTATSQGAAINVVGTQPSITSQPVAGSPRADTAFSLSVSVTGSSPFTYQWRKDGVAVTGQSGANSATLGFTSIKASDSGKYTVVVSNAFGSVTSNEAIVTVMSALTFTEHPASGTFAAGGTATLRARAVGEGAVSYAWYRGGQPLGKTGDTLTLTSLRSSDAGIYTVKATDSKMTVTSLPAVLAVQASQFAGVYLGSTGGGDSWALYVDDSGVATFVGLLSARNQLIVARDIVLQPNGSFQFGSTPAPAAAEGSALTGKYYTGAVTGSISQGVVSGNMSALGIGFNGAVKTGTLAVPTGYFQAVGVASDAADLHVIAAPDGSVVVACADLQGVRGGRGTVNADSTFTVENPAFKYTGTLAPQGGTVTATYTPVSGTTVPFATPATSGGVERLINVATRGLAYGTGDRMLTAGFVIRGSAPKDVMIRAVGPTLKSFGLTGEMANPRLRLLKGQTPILDNDDWQTSGETEVGQAVIRSGTFPLSVGTKDSVILARLEPGGYTAQVYCDDPAASGLVLIEVYDSERSAAPKLINLSTRGFVESGDKVLIAGVVVQGDAPKRMLIRAIGPRLKDYGVGEAVTDPEVSLYKGTKFLTKNDNWGDSPDVAAIPAAAASVGAFDLVAGSKDAAMIVYLAPGDYTVQVRGAGGANGIALVEVYELP